MKKLIPAGSVLVPAEAKLVFSGLIFDIYQWPQVLFDGSTYTFEMLKRTDTVNVIALVDDKIIVIDDEQPHLGKRKSFPGGRVDPDDQNTLDAAKREMIEETGYSFENWRLIAVRQSYRKIEWFVHTYLAWDSDAKQERHLDPGEKIDVALLEFSELKTLVDSSVDYLGESQEIMRNINTAADLLALPDFDGLEVDR